MGSPFNQAYSGTVVAHLDACEALRAIATLPQDDETKIPRTIAGFAHTL